MRNMQIDDATLSQWCTWVPALLESLKLHTNAPLSNANLDFSHNFVTDVGLQQLAELLHRCQLHCACMNFDQNQLTDDALCTIAELVHSPSFALPVIEVKMEHNRVRGAQSILRLAAALQAHHAYPVLRQDVQRFHPLCLRLAHNQIEQPLQATRLLQEATGTLPCVAEEQRFWEARDQCPALQLPNFGKQLPPGLQANPAFSLPCLV